MQCRECFDGLNDPGPEAAVALCAMVAGGQREIESVAIASLGGVAPCGACRQALSEFGLDYSVLLLDSQTQTLRQRWTMQELLPGAFRLAF